MADKQHNALTGAELHEPKGADTAPANTFYKADGAGSGTWTSIPSDTGWISYTDGATAATPLAVTASASVGNAITNDGATTVSSYQPSDLVGSLWNTTSQRFTPIGLGDSYLLQPQFKIAAVASVNFITVELRNGSSTIHEATVPIAAGVGQLITVPLLVTVDSALLSSGGTFHIYKDTVGGTLSIEDVEFFINRLHKGT